MQRENYNPNKPFKRIISVSDINSFLFCARKLYLQRVKRIDLPPNRNMIIGKIKHSILENFSKREETFIAGLDKKYENIDLVFMYEEFIKNIANSVFMQNYDVIQQFMVDKEDILKKTLRDFNQDIYLRIKNIKQAMEKGFFKEDIIKNLDSVYLSELRLESENIGLRGRVDRVQVIKSTNEIIPYELKSREDKVFPADELQLTAYAMLLEDFYRTFITKGIVEVGNNKQEVQITQEHRDEVMRIADEIRNLANSVIPPMQSNFNKCRFCDLKEACAAA